MSSTITPNMGLIVPGVGTEPGPTWATDLNSSLGILDQHNHSSGQGVQIVPSGLNINTDLPMNGNNLTLTKTINFSAQVASLPGTSPNLGCVYVAGNELVYNDESGNVVPITNNGSVNAGAGSITGLPSGTASASYSAGSQTFIWQSATSTPANLDAGSVVFRNITASSKGVTLSAPNALAADYSATLPPANNAGGLVFLTYDTSNNMGVGPLTSSAFVNTGNIVDDSVTQAKLAPRTIATNSDPGVGGVALSSAITFSGSSTTNTDITGLTVTLTTSGRPVFIGLQAPDNGSTSSITVNSAGVAVEVTRSPGPSVFINSIQPPSLTGNFAPSTISFIDTTTAGTPGTYTYQVAGIGGSLSAAYSFTNVVMIAYEI